MCASVAWMASRARKTYSSGKRGGYAGVALCHAVCPPKMLDRGAGESRETPVGLGKRLGPNNHPS